MLLKAVVTKRAPLSKKNIFWLVCLCFVVGILVREYRKMALLDSETTFSPIMSTQKMGGKVLQGASLKKHMPINFVKSANNSCFFEFEKTWFGTIEFETSNNSNDNVIKLKIGELAEDHHVVNNFNSGLINVAYHEVEIMAHQKGVQKIRIDLPSRPLPGGVIMPFGLSGVLPIRYVEVTEGCAEIIESTMYQLALSYKFTEDKSYFYSSNKILNSVYELAKHTIKATSFAGIYIDGYRELKSYEADSYINQLGHYAIDADFLMARHTQEYLLNNGTWPTEWAMYSVFMAYSDYMHTGDKTFLIKNFEKLKKRTLIDLVGENSLISSANQTPEFLRAAGIKAHVIKDIVDWPISERDDFEMVQVRPLLYYSISLEIFLKKIRLALIQAIGYEKAFKLYLADINNLVNQLKIVHPINTVVNSVHYSALNKMAFLASEIGKAGESRLFKNAAMKLKASIQKSLFDRDRELFVDAIGSSHSSKQANVFALNSGLVPPDSTDVVLNHIVANDKGSVYLYQYVLEALFKSDRSKEAMSILTATGNRSWYHMINGLGSSLTTEAWSFDIKPNMDMSHSWATAPVNIIPRYLVGIRPLLPRYKKFIVSPMDAELVFYKMRLPTLVGDIDLDMQRFEDGAVYELTFTGEKTADVFLIRPDCDNFHVSLNGKLSVESDSITKSKRIPIRTLKSGRHRIEIICENKYKSEIGNYSPLQFSRTPSELQSTDCSPYLPSSEGGWKFGSRRAHSQSA